MKYLFVHQHFPGQFLHLVRHLAARSGNEVLFITEATPNVLPGVRVFTYDPPAPNDAVAPDSQHTDDCLRRARLVAGIAAQLKALGLVPDIVIGHHGWGELLNIGDVWPGVPVLGYFEFFYRTHGLDVGFDPEFPDAAESHPRVRARNAVNLLALANPGHGQTPTRFQLETYPAWARPRITLLPEGVDLATCRPNPGLRGATLDLAGFHIAPGDTLVTFVARDLEPYRGVHTVIRAIPRLHRLRPGLKVVLVGGDGVSYGPRLLDGTWRERFMNQVAGVIDPARVCFPGRVPYTTFLALLQRSDAHLYLTYPFVLSWSLREALACACAVVASDTAPVREFVAHRRTGLLVPFHDSAALAEAVQELLDDPVLAARLRRNARKLAERSLAMDAYLDGYEALIARVVSGQAA